MWPCGGKDPLPAPCAAGAWTELHFQDAIRHPLPEVALAFLGLCNQHLLVPPQYVALSVCCIRSLRRTAVCFGHPQISSLIHLSLSFPFKLPEPWLSCITKSTILCSKHFPRSEPLAESLDSKSPQALWQRLANVAHGAVISAISAFQHLSTYYFSRHESQSNWRSAGAMIIHTALLMEIKLPGNYTYTTIYTYIHMYERNSAN